MHNRIPIACFTATVAVLGPSCSGSSAPGPLAQAQDAATPEVSTASMPEYAIHAYHTAADGTRQPIAFEPARSSASEPNPQAGAPTAPSSRTQSAVATPRRKLLTDDTSANPDAGMVAGYDAFALAKYAAHECGAAIEQPLTGGLDNDQSSAQSDVLSVRPGTQLSPNVVTVAGTNVAPWGVGYQHRTWYIFTNGRPVSCTAILAYEEILTCVADKLSELADTVGTVTWANVAPAMGGPLVFPPQADKDRFIARDVARYTLAHVALADVTRSLTVPGTACSEAYANAVLHPDAVETMAVFAQESDQPGYWDDPPYATIDATNAAEVATKRIKYQAGILRSSQRLLKDLVEKSVQADLAGAEQRRAQATSDSLGAQIAWGVQGGPYNSLEHAVWVTAGRLEMGVYTPWNRPDTGAVLTAPRCAGYAPLDPGAFASGYGPDFDARWSDLPVKTDGQKTAWHMVEGSGIVFPSASITLANMTTLRQAVQDQLVADAATASGISPTDPTFAFGDRAQVVTAALGKVTDADLLFALRRGFLLYRLLTNSPATASVDPPAAGLTRSSYIASTVSAAGGVALQGGIAESDLTIDFMARAGGFQELAQCGEPPSSTVIEADGEQQWPFQDSFALADAIRRRLVVLREAATSAGLTGADSATQVAAAAVAEVNGWAHTGRIGVFPTTEQDGQAGFSFLFGNLGFDDLGISSWTDLSTQLEFVYGEPWVADCAASLRTSCDAAALAAAMVPIVAVYDWTDPSAPLTYGDDRGNVEVLVNLPSQISSKGHTPPDATDPKRLYLVLRHDPATPMGAGKVLGSLTLRQDASYGPQLVVSERQRKLLNDIFGMKPDRATSFSGSYCLGLPRDMFVPLENELTSDSDQYENSWKHYLTLAQQAATRADELGQKLIDIGIQEDSRREAAQEALAAQCGDYTAAERLTFANGQVSAPDDDQAMASCLNEPSYDLTFLTDDPFAKLDDKARLTAVKTMFHCDKEPAASSKLCKSSDVQTAGLNFAQGTQNNLQDSCDATLSLRDSLDTGFSADNVANLVPRSWMTQDSVLGLLQSLKFVIADNSQWTLSIGTQVVMDSDDTGKNAAAEMQWPACKRNTGYKSPSNASTYDKL